MNLKLTPQTFEFEGSKDDLQTLFDGLTGLSFGWPEGDDLPDPPEPEERPLDEEEEQEEAPPVQRLPESSHIDTLAAKFTDDDIRQAKTKANALMSRFVPFTLRDLTPDDKTNTHLYRNNKWVYLLEAWLEGVQVDRVVEEKGLVTFYPYYYENRVKVIASHPGNECERGVIYNQGIRSMTFLL